MIEDSELNVLVSNVLSENRYSHCRLCLKDIQDHYVRFHDFVSFDNTNLKMYQAFSGILTTLLGPEICDEIAGIDAVCMACVDKALDCIKFLKTCENSTNILHKIFNSLSGTLSVDIDTTNRDQTLYIAVSGNESKVIVVDKGTKKKAPSNDLQCVKCNGTLMASKSELDAHERSKYRFECSECSEFKCTEKSLKQHQDKAHGVFVCKDCGKSFKTMDKLQIHEQKHITKSECPKCGKTYNTKGFFMKHVKLCLEDLLDPHPIRSNIEKTYSCDKCGKGYSTPGGLRVHNRFVHGNAQPHVCKYCNKEFTAPSYLKVHMVKHTGEKNFKCDLCSRKFVSKEALLYHTRRHTGDKPYSCTMCNEKFVNASARAEHIKFKHVGPTLMCEICSRKFVTPSFLKQHIKKHHDPSNKLYAGRSLIPPNVPAVENMRVRFID